MKTTASRCCRVQKITVVDMALRAGLIIIVSCVLFFNWGLSDTDLFVFVFFQYLTCALKRIC